MSESPPAPGRAVVLHEAVPPGAPPDALDVLEEARVVRAALERLGWTTETLAMTLTAGRRRGPEAPVPYPGEPHRLDLDPARARLESAPPDLVFNLVESLGGEGRLAVLAPRMLEELGLPFTGAPSGAMLVSSSKLLTKEALLAAGIDSPPAWTPDSPASPQEAGWPGPWIVKSCWEHASIGIDDSSVVEASRAPAEVERRRRQGGEWFAEGYVEGREFNLTVMGDGAGPEVLPVAEIDFQGYPPGKPRIVGYPAKWDPGSFEFTHSPRRFDFPGSDRELLDRLRRAAAACWQAIGLAGYARVDFRVDAAGTAWVVDVNANPCLSPDSGFVATAERAGLGYDRLIARIVESALASDAALALRPGSTGAARR